MATAPPKDLLLRPVVDDNPIALHALGVCSALAITTHLLPTAVLCLAVVLVMACSSALVAAIRHSIPEQIRFVVQMIIIATLVTVVDQVLTAAVFDIRQRLSIFVGLIATNCIVTSRVDHFAMHHDWKSSFIDGAGYGLGYSALLLLVGLVRELFGAGTFFGAEILPLRSVHSGSEATGWYVSNELLMLSPSAFFIIGLTIWALRTWKSEPVSDREGVEVASPTA